MLSAEEKRIDRLCEEERYLELHTDLAEKAALEGKFVSSHCFRDKNCTVAEPRHFLGAKSRTEQWHKGSGAQRVLLLAMRREPLSDWHLE